MSRRDLPWLTVVALSLLLGLAASWRRVGDVVVDCGREMNQPLRLLHGERLYADVQHFYGPLTPRLHAALYGIFGPHLDVLRASGAFTTVLIVVLVYWLTRRLAGRLAAATAAFAVTWLCALAPNGNFVLPYSYAAVHGSALALGALASGVGFLERRRPGLLVLSGTCAGLALVTKTEMGAAALVAGVAAALVGGPLQPRSSVRRLLAFGLPALLLPAAVYGTLAADVGTRVLVAENHVLPLGLPGPTVHFLRSAYGFEDPWQALVREGIALARLAVVAALVLLAAFSLARRTQGGAVGVALRHGPWVVIAAAVVMLRDEIPRIDPMAALPPVAAAGIVVTLPRAVRCWRTRSRPPTRTALVLVCGVFALAAMGRTALLVRGNSYGSFMWPAGLMVLAWAATWRLPALLRHPSAIRRARALGAAALVAWTLGAGVLASYHAARDRVYRLVTPRGTMWMGRARGQAFTEAIGFVERETRPGETVAVLPEGTAVLFFTGRRNPLNEELATPGLLDEERAVRRLESTGTRLVLVTNRPTDEYGAHAFGRDYARRTMQWIEARFRPCGVFGVEARPDRRIGSGRFFIRAYCRG